jgi:hypothetical protein
MILPARSYRKQTQRYRTPSRGKGCRVLGTAGVLACLLTCYNASGADGDLQAPTLAVDSTRSRLQLGALRRQSAIGNILKPLPLCVAESRFLR